MGDGENREEVNWVRGPKLADLSKVSIIKILNAHEQRGIEVEVPSGNEGKASVIKTVVTGLPAPTKKDSAEE